MQASIDGLAAIVAAAFAQPIVLAKAIHALLPILRLRKPTTQATAEAAGKLEHVLVHRVAATLQVVAALRPLRTQVDMHRWICTSGYAQVDMAQEKTDGATRARTGRQHRIQKQQHRDNLSNSFPTPCQHVAKQTPQSSHAFSQQSPPFGLGRQQRRHGKMQRMDPRHTLSHLSQQASKKSPP